MLSSSEPANLPSKQRRPSRESSDVDFCGLPHRSSGHSSTWPSPALLCQLGSSQQNALTPRGLHERQLFAQTLQSRYHCSAACASSTVEDYYPDKELCSAMVENKMTSAFVFSVGMVTTQIAYLDQLVDDLAKAFAYFPFLQRFQTDKLDEGKRPALPVAARDTSPSFHSQLPPVDWAEVRTRLLASDKPRLWLMHLRHSIPKERNDLCTLEEAYQSLIVRKGFAHVVGCFAGGDGLLPTIDYVNARLCGETTDSMLRRLQSEREVINTVKGMPDEASCTGAPTRFNCLGNDPSTSCSYRQDKGRAQEVLKEAGLACIRSFVTRSVEEAIARIRDGALQLPVIAKPNSGAGSEYVTLCCTEEDLYVAFEVVQGVRTSQGTDAGVLVVEEYVEGPEYVVNTVSYHGTHVVTDVWESWKYPQSVATTSVPRGMEQRVHSTGLALPPRQRVSILYDKQTLISDLASLPPDHDARRITAYTLQCLDALGLVNGCGHSEVRMDQRRVAAGSRAFGSPQNGSAATPARASAGEPVLIELNSRMQGDIPRSTEVVGYDQYSLLLYIAEAANVFGGSTGASTTACFRRAATRPSVPGDIPWPPVPRLYHAKPSTSAPLSTTVLFLAAGEDCLLNGPALHTIAKLPTFVRFTRTCFPPNSPGFVTSLKRTVDLFSSPTTCVMQGTASAVEADCALIRAMESAKLCEQARAALTELTTLHREVAVVDNHLKLLRASALAADDAHRGACHSFLASTKMVGEEEEDRHERRQSSEGDNTGNHRPIPRQMETFPETAAEVERELFETLSLIESYQQNLKVWRDKFTEAFAQQHPVPLYISYTDFEMMALVSLGSLIATT